MVYKKKQKAKWQNNKWYMIVCFLALTVVSATMLRLNNVGMIRRREAVLLADKNNQEAVLSERLYDLQRYVFSHMNTSTGPFFLEYQYRRDAKTQLDQAKDKSQLNGEDAHAKAARICEEKFKDKALFYKYVNCYQQELDKTDAGGKLISEIKLPNVNLYRKDFESPAFSFDWAGLAVGFWLVIFFYYIVHIFIWIIFKIIVIITHKRAQNS